MMKKSKSPLTLGDLKYLSVEDSYFFGDVVSPRHGGPSAKFSYLDVGKKFYKEVAAAIAAKLPNFTSKITTNAAGPVVAGDVSMVGQIHQRTVYSSLLYDQEAGFSRLFWRIGTGAYAADGVNIWVETASTTAERVAADILTGMERIVGAERSAHG
jgi:hypothetical protein